MGQHGGGVTPKEALDAIARIVHPEWPEGTRETYTPSWIVERVQKLEEDRRHVIATRKKLRKALIPFGARCLDYERDNATSGRYPDDAPLELEGRGSPLTVGDLRNARDALEIPGW